LTATATIGTSKTVDSTSFYVAVGAANKLGFTMEPSGAVATVAFTRQPVVAVQDAGGNTATSDSVTSVVMSKKSGPGTLSGTLTKTAVSGLATFTDLELDAEGAHVLTATATIGTSKTVDSTSFTAVEAAAQISSGVCTASANTGTAVLLTWTESTQTHIWARACTSSDDAAQANNADIVLRAVTDISVAITPTALPVGGEVSLIYTGWTTGSVWVCYSSSSSAIQSSPNCAAAGTATDRTITASGSGTATLCTASESSGAPVVLTWAEVTQTHIRARACKTVNDEAQADNDAAVLSALSPMSVSITPTTLKQGSILSLEYMRRSSGAVWICYTSGAVEIAASPSCAAPGAAVDVADAGSGRDVSCTASATTGTVVSLVWAEATQTHIRVRACTAVNDAAQTDNADVTLALPAISVALVPTMLIEGDSLWATFTHWSVGAVWICFASGTSPLLTSPSCDAAAIATDIATGGSGDGTVCTAGATDGAPVALTWTDSTQTHIRVRACRTPTDVAQVDNADVTLVIRPISVVIAPMVLAQGGALSATYAGWSSGDVWICYSSGMYSWVALASPSCAPAGAATAVTADGSGRATLCTTSASDGAAVTLTWTQSNQKYIRARACTTATDAAQADNARLTLTAVLAISVVITPTTLAEGSALSVAYTGWVNGAVWLCYRTGAAAIASSPSCDAATGESTITSDGSGTRTVCTASASDGAPVSLTWDSTQTHIRARACRTSTDAAQSDNADVTLTAVTSISLAITPTTLVEGDALSVAYTGWATGDVWICFRTGASPVSTSPSCAAAGAATTVTMAGSGTATVCTESAADAVAVSLIWLESTQKHIRARACIVVGDVAQADNADVSLSLVSSEKTHRKDLFKLGTTTQFKFTGGTGLWRAPNHDLVRFVKSPFTCPAALKDPPVVKYNEVVEHYPGSGMPEVFAKGFPEQLGTLSESVRGSDAVFRISTFIPQDKEGCLFEAGGTVAGTFVGVVRRDNDFYFRFQAFRSGLDPGFVSGSGTALIMIKLPDPRFSGWRTLVWTISMSRREIVLYVDGREVASATATIPSQR